jgi:hypothetical protein
VHAVDNMSLLILLSVFVSIIALVLSARFTSRQLYRAAGRWFILALMLGFLFPVLGLKPANAASIGAAEVRAGVDEAVPGTLIAPHALRHDSSSVLAFVHHSLHVSLRSRSLTSLNAMDTGPGTRNNAGLASLQQAKRIILGQWLSAAVNPVKVTLVLLC